MILHADEARCTELVGHVEHLGELPGHHARGTQIKHFAGLHEVFKGSNRFFDGRLIVEPVYLVEVYVVRSQPTEAVVDRMENVLSRQAPLVRVLAHGHVHLGPDDDTVSGRTEVFERTPKNLLTAAAGIHVGRVDEVNPQLQRLSNERPTLCLLQNPFSPARGAIGHRAQANPGYFESG